MIKGSLTLGALALAITAGRAGAQDVACAIGYATAFTNVSATASGGDEELDAASGIGFSTLARVGADCRPTFLSDDPSLLPGGTDLVGDAWKLAMYFRKGATVGGKVDGFGAYGTNPDGSSIGSGWTSGAIAAGSDEQDLSPVREVVCEFLGGGACGGGNAGGFGGTGSTPGDYLADEHAAFVEAIHNANGGGNPWGGPGGPGGNGGNGGENGTGGDPFIDPVTGAEVLELGDPSAAADVAPEPATMVLLASGLAGMAAAGRRRRK